MHVEHYIGLMLPPRNFLETPPSRQGTLFIAAPVVRQDREEELSNNRWYKVMLECECCLCRNDEP